MARMLPKDAVEAYLSGEPPPFLLDYDPALHYEEMLDVATGLIGAMLKLDLYSLSGPEIGSRVPIVVCNVPGDLLRIFVDPDIAPYGPWVDVNRPYIKKAREFLELTAFSYKGDPLRLDTKSLFYANYIGLGAELQYQATILEALPRIFPSTADT